MNEFNLAENTQVSHASFEVDGINYTLNITHKSSKVIGIAGDAKMLIEGSEAIIAHINYEVNPLAFGISIYGSPLAKLPKDLFTITLDKLNKLHKTIEKES